MATHGLMLGAAAAVVAFALAYKKSFLALADELVIPGAFLMGMGRLGNFIDGLIVGSVTDVWWAVKFPDAEGFRHPVVLYDGAKNLLLMLFLLRVRKTHPTPGATAARFVFWYAFLRIFIDLFRDYPTHRLALGTGQTLNIIMALLGIVLLIRSRLRRLGHLAGGQGTCGRAADRAPRTVTACGSAVGTDRNSPVLSDHSEQLDAGHSRPIRRTAPGAAALVVVSSDRHDGASALTFRGRTLRTNGFTAESRSSQRFLKILLVESNAERPYRISTAARDTSPFLMSF